MKAQKSNNFVIYPGNGWLHKQADAPAGVSLWQGKLALHETHPSGNIKEVSLQAKAIRAPLDATKAQLKEHEKLGGNRYEVKCILISEEGPWQHLGEFKMPAFGERNSQVVTTPVGKLLAMRRDTNVAFKLLRDASGVRRHTVVL